MAPDLNSLPASPAPGKAVNLTRSALSSGPAPGEKLPNILYIMADQLAAPLLKMYNPDSQILTPNLDALAARSVQFDSAYCPSPLCAPSRMSMITGQLPMKIGAYDNASSISSDIPTYAHYLRLKGYHTVLAGKMHFVGDQLHGYETRLTSDIYPGDYGWAVNWDEPDTRLEWYHNASSILQAGVCVRSNQLDYDEEVMYRSTQFLYDYVREGPDARPFCLTVSPCPLNRSTGGSKNGGVKCSASAFCLYLRRLQQYIHDAKDDPSLPIARFGKQHGFHRLHDWFASLGTLSVGGPFRGFGDGKERVGIEGLGVNSYPIFHFRFAYQELIGLTRCGSFRSFIGLFDAPPRSVHHRAKVLGSLRGRRH